MGRLLGLLLQSKWLRMVEKAFCSGFDSLLNKQHFLFNYSNHAFIIRSYSKWIMTIINWNCNNLIVRNYLLNTDRWNFTEYYIWLFLMLPCCISHNDVSKMILFIIKYIDGKVTKSCNLYAQYTYIIITQKSFWNKPGTGYFFPELGLLSSTVFIRILFIHTHFNTIQFQNFYWIKPI